MQSNLTIPNSTGYEFRQNVMKALKTVYETQVSTEEPSETFPGAKWADSSVVPLRTKVRDSGNTSWLHQPGVYQYDSSIFSNVAFVGYDKGDIVMRSDGTGYWFNTIDNNITDPEASGAATAGWVPDYQAGATTVAMSGSSVTLTPDQYGKPLITITGALSTNLNLIFPTLAQGWIVINNTTGGYSITAKTTSGSGVTLGTISQIVCDGTNVYAANTDSVQIVTNVAALRNIPPSLSLRIQTRGYYIDEDGGGAQYFPKVGASAGTYVHNGGTVILPNGGDGSSAWLIDLSSDLSVLQCGADRTGVVDSTSAFNIATQATIPWSSALEYNITIPSGKYKIDGTVYVRKGQTLSGLGHGVYIDCSGNINGTNPSFSLGNGLINGVPTSDVGGSPVKIENLWTNGGSSNRGVIYTNAAGFEINSLFITASGIGLEINGADGIISNIELDQSLSAISMHSSQNIVLTNVNVYLPNYAITFNSDCFDITINGGIIEYPRYAGILFSENASNIKSINLAGINFTMNAQYETFVGYIHKRASTVEVKFTNCSFRNWYQYCIQDAAGVECSMTFNACTFDANRTNPAYNQTTTAKVLNTGSTNAAGVYSFYDCEYRNLHGEIATINDGVSQLSLVGGKVQDCDVNSLSQQRFNIISNKYGHNITVKNVLGFPYKTNDANNQYIILPYWSGCTQWEISVVGNTYVVGSNTYSRAEKGVVSVSTAYNGASIVEYCDYDQMYKTTTRSIPGDINLVACFGDAPGGVLSQQPTTIGVICVSSNTTVNNAREFKFYAETLL